MLILCEYYVLLRNLCICLSDMHTNLFFGMGQSVNSVVWMLAKLVKFKLVLIYVEKSSIFVSRISKERKTRSNKDKEDTQQSDFNS